MALPEVLSRLIEKIDGVDEERIARDFERLLQGNKESVTSFNERFIEASKAYKIFYDLTEEEELVKFVTKLRVSNQKQLKLLRLDSECIEDVFDAVSTFETSQGFEQKRSINFTKKYKDRFYKKKKPYKLEVQEESSKRQSCAS